jgi:hypothetical protein
MGGVGCGVGVCGVFRFVVPLFFLRGWPVGGARGEERRVVVLCLFCLFCLFPLFGALVPDCGGVGECGGVGGFMVGGAWVGGCELSFTLRLLVVVGAGSEEDCVFRLFFRLRLSLVGWIGLCCGTCVNVAGWGVTVRDRAVGRLEA